MGLIDIFAFSFIYCASGFLFYLLPSFLQSTKSSDLYPVSFDMSKSNSVSIYDKEVEVFGEFKIILYISVNYCFCTFTKSKIIIIWLKLFI